MSEVDSRNLDRRQLLKAGAWAAPVIVLAAATPAAAASIALPQDAIVIRAKCVEMSGETTEHGFTLSNTSDATATVVVNFRAQAWGVIRLTAVNNVVSVTTGTPAEYPVSSTGGGEIVGGLTYQGIWETVNQISVEPSVAGGGRNATREGQAVFLLPPHSSVTFGQINANALGEPTVYADIYTINGQGVFGSSAIFSFEWGGACTIPTGP